MKTLYTISLIIFIQLLNADELKWVDEQIKAIQPPREGMQSIRVFKDPFIFLKKDDNKKKSSKLIPSNAIPLVTQSTTNKKVNIAKRSTLNLSIIINKSAKINNRWYKKGDIISGHKILSISSSSVVIVKNKKQTILSTKNKNKNLKLKH